MSGLRLWLVLLVCAVVALSCVNGSSPAADPATFSAPNDSTPAPATTEPDPFPEPPCAPDSVAQLTPLPSRGLSAMTAPGELPHLQIAGDAVSKVTLKQTRVEASITGLVADVEVVQLYENTATTPIETTYVFPLPDNAAVYRMTMVIGERTIEAVVKPREEAQRLYKAAKQAGHTAALLSQERPNVFTQQVANIAPGKSIAITLRYVQDLAYDSGQVELVFPMVVGPRYIPGAPTALAASGNGNAAATDEVPDAARISPPILGKGERTGQDIALAVTVRGATSLRELETPTHAVVSGHAADGSFRLALAAADKIPNRDFVMRYRADDAKPLATLYRSGGDRGYFSLVVHPPALDVNELVGRRELVFVVDVSGSMSGSPLTLCKQAMREALAQLRPLDTFNVITFAGATGKLFPEPRQATQESIRAARAYVDRMSAGGGTEMLDAVAAALSPDVAKDRHRYVFFLTDGFVGNEAAIVEATGKFVAGIEKQGQRARVFGFGVGSSPNRALMNGLARQGKGVAITATNREDPSRAVNRFFRFIDRSVLRDLHIDFGGLATSEIMPAALPDLFASRALILHGRYSGKLSGPVVVRGTGANGAVTLPVRVADGPAADGWPILALLWARSKITWLDDGLAQDAGAAAEITKLGLDYHLVTAFTSFVAVDSASTVKGPAADVRVPVEVPEGVDPVMAGAAGAAGVSAYGYEFSDDPLAAGGFSPGDATIRVRSMSLSQRDAGTSRGQISYEASARVDRGLRGCMCDLAAPPSTPALPWLALGLVAGSMARRRQSLRLRKNQ